MMPGLKRLRSRQCCSSFLHSCLKEDERNRMSAAQLLEHSFITPAISSGLPNGKETVRNNGLTGNDGGLSPVDQPEHEGPVPDFSFFSGVPGKSRVKCEFEELQFLGKGGFGNVIKVSDRSLLRTCFANTSSFFLLSSTYKKISFTSKTL